MKKTFLLVLVLGSVLVACKDQKPIAEKPASAIDTMETSRLGTAVDAYVAVPSKQNAAAVDQAFAKIDSEIAELERRVAETSGQAQVEAQVKERELRDYRDKERLRYTEAQTRAKAAAASDKVEKASDTAGDKIKDAAESVKDGVDHAIDKAKKAF